MKPFVSIMFSLAVQPVINGLYREIGTYDYASSDYSQFEGGSWEEKTFSERKERLKKKGNKGLDVEGDDVEIGEFPYVVALLRRGAEEREQFCVGTLFALDRVLTACHCLMKPKLDGRPRELLLPGDVQLSAGGVTVSKEEFESGDTQLRFAKELTVHPLCFTYEKLYDMGVAVLDRPFATVPDALEMFPIPFYDDHEYIDLLSRNKTRCVTMGWGSEHHNVDSRPETMQKMETMLMPAEWCSKMVYEMSKNEPNGPEQFDEKVHICARGLKKYQTVCVGDSGAPLMCAESNVSMTIVGVLSFWPGSDPCGKASIPMVYARIEHFDITPFVPKASATIVVSYAISTTALAAFVIINALDDFLLEC